LNNESVKKLIDHAIERVDEVAHFIDIRRQPLESNN